MKQSSKTDRSNQPKKRKGTREAKSLPILNVDAAGVDIGSAEHWVAVPEGRDDQPVRKFGCFTADLHAMAVWLERCGVTTVAMESTGVYWINLFQILDNRGFDVKLVNARHVKNAPGRKTDVLDCQWLQRLHTYGLLPGSFRPEDAICVLRNYWRYRDNLIRYVSAHVQHMQKALTEMNLRLHKVVSDITGVTGMRIIRAILEGKRNPMELAEMKDYRIRSSSQMIAKALQGDYRTEHLFALKQAVELYDFYQQQIKRCDDQIETCLSEFDSRVNPEIQPIKGKPKKSGGNEPKFDLRTHLYRINGRDFTQIDGLNSVTVHTIVSEVGVDQAAFPSEKHFASWLALCPNNRITGGRIKSSKTRKSTNRAADAFRLAAQSLASSKSALGGYYRRMKTRLGAPKAITATAHKLARIFYHMWKAGDPYHDPGVDYYEQRYKDRVLNNIKKKGKSLGYEIILQPLEKSTVS